MSLKFRLGFTAVLLAVWIVVWVYIMFVLGGV